ncbi:PaaI family thioesterase [Georgenia alba]|uniref:PaaI family thioesterase n=1 Tax=Georgenia alba TaxID=2233858 RepID=A0ABW2QCL4_9MICO
MTDVTDVPDPTAGDLLGWLNARAAGTLVERLGIEFLEAGPDGVVARMPVSGNTQFHGILHGGATAALAETVGSVAAGLHAGRDRTVVGVDLNVTHHRSATTGHVTARTTTLHQGRRVASYDVVVTDEDDRRLCTARLTCMILGDRTAAPG